MTGTSILRRVRKKLRDTAEKRLTSMASRSDSVLTRTASCLLVAAS